MQKEEFKSPLNANNRKEKKSKKIVDVFFIVGIFLSKI
jgi:hypothetical protein